MTDKMRDVIGTGVLIAVAMVGRIGSITGGVSETPPDDVPNPPKGQSPTASLRSSSPWRSESSLAPSAQAQSAQSHRFL
jgi:hypothetical protein